MRSRTASSRFWAEEVLHAAPPGTELYRFPGVVSFGLVTTRVASALCGSDLLSRGGLPCLGVVLSGKQAGRALGVALALPRRPSLAPVRLLAFKVERGRVFLLSPPASVFLVRGR